MHNDYARRAIAATPDAFYLQTQPLTGEQVADLPHGADVLILWSGGNGPHRYKVKRCDCGRECGRVFAAMVPRPWQRPPYPRDDWRSRPVEFTGSDRPFTIVWRIHPVSAEEVSCVR